jgi:hypothetical protein
MSRILKNRFIRQWPLVLEGGFEKSHIENILDGFLWDNREPRENRFYKTMAASSRRGVLKRVI